jgi:hypothetical protein
MGRGVKVSADVLRYKPVLLQDDFTVGDLPRAISSAPPADGLMASGLPDGV